MKEMQLSCNKLILIMEPHLISFRKSNLERILNHRQKKFNSVKKKLRELGKRKLKFHLVSNIYLENAGKFLNA